MVVSGSTVCVVAVAVFTVFIIVAVFVTLVAHLTFTTIHAVGEVALDFVRVVLQVLPVLCVTHHVGPVAPRAVPVLPKKRNHICNKSQVSKSIFQVPAVEVVRIPPVFLVRAIFSGGVTSFAVVVTFVADWSLPAVGVLLEVAPIEDEVIDFWIPCCRIIWAEQVFSFPLVAVPVFSAVVGVWEIPISKLTAVRNMSTVNGCGRGGAW